MKLTPEGVLITSDALAHFFRQNTSPSTATAFETHALSFLTIFYEASEQQRKDCSFVHGEAVVFDELSSKLLQRDGYTIESSEENSSNKLIVRRQGGYADIIINTKACNNKVPTSEVKKFDADLVETNSHGILVSLYSGIVGKGRMDIDQLKNGKLVIYLSNTGSSIDSIVDAIAIIHHLSKTLSKDNENSRVTTETMTKVRSALEEFSDKISSLRSKLQESLTLLDYTKDVILDKLLSTLCLNIQTTTPTDSSLKCTFCNKVCQNGTGLSAHQRKCPERKAPAAPSSSLTLVDDVSDDSTTNQQSTTDSTSPTS